MTEYIIVFLLGVCAALAAGLVALWRRREEPPQHTPETTGLAFETTEPIESPTPDTALPDDPLEKYHETNRPDDTDNPVISDALHSLDGADDLIQAIERGRDHHPEADRED